jgi:hypothetical protein
MTTNEITQLARKKLLEAGTEIIDDTTILIYANLAYKDVIKKAFPKNSILSATVSFTAGSGTLPSLFGTVYTDAVDVNNNVFPEMSIADFQRAEIKAENAIVVEGGVMKVSPDTTTSLTVKYYPTYPTLTATVDPSIDEYLHEPIVYGILARAYEDLQDPELSAFFETKFGDMLLNKINTLSNYEEDGQKGGQMFNGINIIGRSANNDPDRW